MRSIRPRARLGALNLRCQFRNRFLRSAPPYQYPGATGHLRRPDVYTTPAHIAGATLEASASQTRAAIESVKLDSKSELARLKAYGGMKNGYVATEMLAEVGGFEVVLPEMWESSALVSALLSGIAIGLFWRGQRRLGVSIRRVVCALCCVLRF